MGSLASDDVKVDMPSVELPQAHAEIHSSNSEYLESAVLGMADGLTVPFALTAGLSSYVWFMLALSLLTCS
jgi:hypothetical protein